MPRRRRRVRSTRDARLADCRSPSRGSRPPSGSSGPVARERDRSTTSRYHCAWRSRTASRSSRPSRSRPNSRSVSSRRYRGRSSSTSCTMDLSTRFASSDRRPRVAEILTRTPLRPRRVRSFRRTRTGARTGVARRGQAGHATTSRDPALFDVARLSMFARRRGDRNVDRALGERRRAHRPQYAPPRARARVGVRRGGVRSRRRPRHCRVRARSPVRGCDARSTNSRTAGAFRAAPRLGTERRDRRAVRRATPVRREAREPHGWSRESSRRDTS